MSEVHELRRQVVILGGRLPGFDHSLIEESSKPSDPSDIRWDCLCGVSGSPDKINHHLEANLAEYDKEQAGPPASAERVTRPGECQHTGPIDSQAPAHPGEYRCRACSGHVWFDTALPEAAVQEPARADGERSPRDGEGAAQPPPASVEAEGLDVERWWVEHFQAAFRSDLSGFTAFDEMTKRAREYEQREGTRE